jgi:hypothetical protein
MFPPEYQPEPFLKPRDRRQTIAFYLESLRSNAQVLEELPPWHTEVRCGNTRYFLGLEGLNPSDKDTTELYNQLARIEQRGRQRSEELS